MDAATTAAFELINRTFDKVVVVTIERAVERQRILTERLAGLRYELAFGADKQKLTEAGVERDGLYSEARARRLGRHDRPLSLGHVAASLSHRLVYQRMLREGWRNALVFEDDVLVRPEGLAALPAILAELPSTWEFVYFGWFRGEQVTPFMRAKQLAYLPLSALRLIRWTPRMVLNLYARPYSAHLKRAGFHLGAHAYALTPSAARKLLERQTPVAFHCDQLFVDQVLRGAVEAYVTEPCVFDQDSILGTATSLIAS